MLLIDLIESLKKVQAEIAEISPTFYTAFSPNSPATKNEISMIQKLAPFPLPEDYLELLKICNGWQGMFFFETHLLSVQDQQRSEVKKIFREFYEQQAEWTEEYAFEEVFPIAVSTLGWNSIVFIHSYNGKTKYVHIMEDLTVFNESSNIKDFLFSHLKFTIDDLEHEKKQPSEKIIGKIEAVPIQRMKDVQELTEYDINSMKSGEVLDRIIAILFYQKEIVDLPLPEEFFPNQVVGKKAMYYLTKKCKATGDPFSQTESKMYADRLLIPYSKDHSSFFLERDLLSLGWDIEISNNPYECIIRVNNKIISTVQGDSRGEVLSKAAILTYFKLNSMI